MCFKISTAASVYASRANHHQVASDECRIFQRESDYSLPLPLCLQHYWQWKTFSMSEVVPFQSPTFVPPNGPTPKTWSPAKAGGSPNRKVDDDLTPRLHFLLFPCRPRQRLE
jgi:hypothetical protein